MEDPRTQKEQEPITAPIESVTGRGRARMARVIQVSSLVLLVFVLVFSIFEYRSNALPVLANTEVASAAAAMAVEEAFSDIVISAKSAIVIDLKNNTTLYAHNPDIQLPLASLIKIPLALVVSEALSPDVIVTIPRDTAPKGSVIRLAKGDRWRVQDVIDFTLVASSNIGAEILAEAADNEIRARYPEAPEGGAAIWRMNELSKELGLTRTYFLNVNGLDESSTLSGAYGSARDIATLYAYAVSSNPSIFRETTESGIHLTSADGSGKTVAYNTNEALDDIPSIIMGKTGITDLAGGNLAVIFDVAPSHSIVAVVLGSTREGRFRDMRQLVEKTHLIVSQEK